MESKDNRNNFLGKSLGSQPTETDHGMKENEDKVHVLPYDNVQSLEELETTEFDNKVFIIAGVSNQFVFFRFVIEML